MIWLDPPLDPSGTEAHRLLRNELLDPVYHQQNVIQQILAWLEREVNKGLDRASSASQLSTLATMLIFVGLVVLLVWLASRARSTARVRDESRAALTEEVVTAAELRVRAESALGGDRFEEAVVEGFRALAVRQVERGRLRDTPGTTADEVARALAAEYPALGERVQVSALLFDEVLYGGRPATRAQAESLLALDDDLVVRR